MSAPLPEDPAQRLMSLVHDLRTPLVVVAGFADLLATRQDLDATQRAEFAVRLRDAARDLVALLDDERATRPDWA